MSFIAFANNEASAVRIYEKNRYCLNNFRTALVYPFFKLICIDIQNILALVALNI